MRISSIFAVILLSMSRAFNTSPSRQLSYKRHGYRTTAITPRPLVLPVYIPVKQQKHRVVHSRPTTTMTYFPPPTKISPPPSSAPNVRNGVNLYFKTTGPVNVYMKSNRYQNNPNPTYPSNRMPRRPPLSAPQPHSAALPRGPPLSAPLPPPVSEPVTDQVSAPPVSGEGVVRRAFCSEGQFNICDDNGENCTCKSP
eukprot:GHVR01009387.1.p1 GENE.GHVR01009387.1~~GHVR01009387.1.p1  ORF type:complete len:197 (-),score=37.87 GHVR01009387.1:213-803(-)